MKKTFLAAAIFFTLFSTQVFSQKINSGVLTGFWNIPWGTERQAVIDTLTSKGIRPSFDSQTEIDIENSFGGKNAKLGFGFYQDKLFMGVVQYYEYSNNLLEDYRNVVNLIKSKYGESSSTEKKYESLISNEDLYKELAIKMGHATISTTWNFSDGNLLICYIDKESHNVILVYTETETYVQYANEDKAKKMSDF